MMKDGEKLGIFKEYDTEGKLIKEGENKKEKIIEDYNLQELINLLKNNSELKIEAMIYEEQRGAFQVIDEKEYEEFYANLSWNKSNSSPRAIIDSSNEIYDDISDADGESLVNSFLHHGFRSSEIIPWSRTAGVLSENNENETTTTSKNLIFGSLIDGWEKPPQRSRFYNDIQKF